MGCRTTLIFTVVVVLLAIVYTLFYVLAAPATQEVMDQGLKSVGLVAGVAEGFVVLLIVALVVAAIKGARR